LGQCRFSKLAPGWGEFYLVEGDAELLDAPKDWQSVSPKQDSAKHYLFYFRDETFECSADECVIEPSVDNSLFLRGKVLPTLSI
jgi:hypothetical protein